MIDSARVGIVGLGYVGLPLLCAFSRLRKDCFGYDLSVQRIHEIKSGIDRTGEIKDVALLKGLEVSIDIRAIADCDVIIITVPTPLDEKFEPDLSFLLRAVSDVSEFLGNGKILVLESTVYPGVTEDICIPLITKLTGLSLNRDFFVGYSPERINPGDAGHSLTSVVKVVASSSPGCTAFLKELYGQIIEAGVYEAASIRVAEMAKAIENTQRDVNVALMNEFCMLAERLGLPFDQVRKTALTKWNFLDFTPGLVGGHCIGIDPYYLLHKARAVGSDMSVVESSRARNEGMSSWLVSRVANVIACRFPELGSVNVLIVGFTFKKDCPDVRNTKIADLVVHGQSLGWKIDVFDPLADPDEVKLMYDIDTVSQVSELNEGRYHAVIFAVGHKQVVSLGQELFSSKLVVNAAVIGLQDVFPEWEFDLRI